MTALETAPPITGGFRHALRLDTRGAHDGAEALFARFHDDPLPNMTWFLSVQRAALIALADSTAPGSPRLCSVVLEDLVERLDFDLAHEPVPAVTVSPDRPLDGLAVDYLVLGSRLGTEVLRRRLSVHMDRYEMPTYFLAPSSAALWQRHCAQLNDIVPGSPLAQRVSEDAISGFGLFEKAAAALDL